MSRSTIRTAVKNYFDAPAIPGLVKVRSARPKAWPTPDDWRHDTLLSTMGGYVYIEGVVEKRATTGKRYLEYTVGLQLIFRTRDTDAEAAMAAFDTMIDAIKAHARVKPAGGGGLGVSDGSIFQAAEKLLEDLSDDTQDDALLQSVRAVVRFDVSEWITA